MVLADICSAAVLLNNEADKLKRFQEDKQSHQDAIAALNAAIALQQPIVDSAKTALKALL